MKKLKLNFGKLLKKIPKDNFRKAAKSYINTAIRLYIKVEARVSVWDDERFGDSANIVCSLSRAVEHLLKLRLLKLDPGLLYPFPKKAEEYCCVKQINMKNYDDKKRKRRERELLSHTVSFKEALSRVDLTQSSTSYDFTTFNSIYALRNSLEHHWDRNEEFLKKVVSNMSRGIIPCLKEFIQRVLKEKSSDYFDNKLLKEVRILDRAIERGHFLELQRRFEEHSSLYSKDVRACRRKYSCPVKYRMLNEEETEVKCPICKHPFRVLWDWEADYDVVDGEECVSGAFPDSKCLDCTNCHFFVEGSDVDTYLPDGIDIDPEPPDEY